MYVWKYRSIDYFSSVVNIAGDHQLDCRGYSRRRVTGDNPPWRQLPGYNPLPKIPPGGNPLTLLYKLVLGSEIWVSVNFQIIPRPVSRLGLGSGPHVVGPLGSGPRVLAGGGYIGVFSVGGCLRGSSLQEGYLNFNFNYNLITCLAMRADINLLVVLPLLWWIKIYIKPGETLQKAPRKH